MSKKIILGAVGLVFSLCFSTSAFAISKDCKPYLKPYKPKFHPLMTPACLLNPNYKKAKAPKPPAPPKGPAASKFGPTTFEEYNGKETIGEYKAGNGTESFQKQYSDLLNMHVYDVTTGEIIDYPDFPVGTAGTQVTAANPNLPYSQYITPVEEPIDPNTTYGSPYSDNGGGGFAVDDTQSNTEYEEDFAIDDELDAGGVNQMYVESLLELGISQERLDLEMSRLTSEEFQNWAQNRIDIAERINQVQGDLR